nr:Eco57I restriction-modification methylase domain-containing protein [Brachyspira pilosicoli]
MEILPNLEFKIVSANSLIELDDKEVNLISLTWDKNELIKNMREYFNASYENKSKIRKEILNLIKEYSNHNAKLENYNPFDMLKSYDFFDSGLMFGVDKFDLVIGNPPYVSNKEISSKDMENYKKLYGIQDDLYYYFFIKGIKLLDDNSVLSYITSNSFLTIQTKIGLRKLLQSKRLLEIINTGNVFEHAEVEPAIVSLINREEKNYKMHYSDNTKEENPVSKKNKIEIDVSYFVNSPNCIFFTPTEYNLMLYKKLVSKASILYKDKWHLIKTSKDIEKNEKQLDAYRNSLKAGDITLLGLITDGGVGLQTGDNGVYVGVLENTKDAERVYSQRIEKLNKFNKENKTNYDISKMNEIDIRKLFDSIKEKYGKNSFGQGFIYRIVSKNEMADLNTLTLEEKEDGINNQRSFVAYDKGDKEGNKWYAPTVYAIDWSKKNVDILKTDSKARWQGYNFFFKSGFSWNNVLNPNSQYIKGRYKEVSINDVASMSLYTLYEKTSAKYFLILLNSYFIFYYLRTFINNTVNLQINDMRQLPIIIPTEKQLKEAEALFDRGKSIREDRINGVIDEVTEEKLLKELQNEVDVFVLGIYGLE